MRCATSSPSSKRSPRLQSARRPPADTSGSGVAASVHCGGTEQIRPSAKRSSQRLPARLPRFAMHTPPCPEYGWKGWVTVTRCGEAGEIPAFLTEVQAARGWRLYLAAGAGWRGQLKYPAAAHAICRHGLDTDTRALRAANEANDRGRKNAEYALIFWRNTRHVW